MSRQLHNYFVLSLVNHMVASGVPMNFFDDRTDFTPIGISPFQTNGVDIKEKVKYFYAMVPQQMCVIVFKMYCHFDQKIIYRFGSFINKADGDMKWNFTDCNEKLYTEFMSQIP